MESSRKCDCDRKRLFRFYIKFGQTSESGIILQKLWFCLESFH